jgi:WD40 repeat protein
MRNQCEKSSRLELTPLARDSERALLSKDVTHKRHELETVLPVVADHGGGATRRRPAGLRLVTNPRDIFPGTSCVMLATFEGHAAPVTACAVTPDGRRVVSASDDRTLKVWDFQRGCA